MARMQAGGRVGGATLLALAFAFIAAAASAADAKFPAAVAWAHDDLVYLAAPDSGTLAEGMRLGIERRHHRLANVTITRLFEPRLAVARVDSGAVTFKKRFDRLQIVPLGPAVPHVAVLRVGLPGRGRGGLLFSCASAGVASRLGPTRYDVQPSGRDAFRLVRSDSTAGPDTLLVRTFADAADQEIALERGEVDVAVFWPGELSAHMRADPRWRNGLVGTRQHEWVMTAGADSLPAVDLVRLNRDLFAGDLRATPQLDSALAAGTGVAPVNWRATVPGQKTVERFLERWSNPRGKLAALYVGDRGPVHGDRVQLLLDTTPVFAIGCPVLTSLRSRAAVSAIGPDAFANLMTCGGKGTP
jgi:hypothetical protein